MRMFMPTYATETLEQTLGNATIAANYSVQTAQSIGFAASNASTFLRTLNTGTKYLSVGYGVALTGASAIDAFTAKNTYSRCMFRFSVGCGLGTAGTISSALTTFNISVGLGPVAMVSAVSSGCYIVIYLFSSYD